MIGKKIVLLAVAAAVPLTALGAAPASATQQHSSDDPSVHIQKVSYYDDYFKVKVTYRCYSDDDEHGNLNVSVAQKHASYASWDNKAHCDGYWHNKWVYSYNTEDEVELESGKLRVKAELEDADGDHDSDRRTYRIKFHH